MLNELASINGVDSWRSTARMFLGNLPEFFERMTQPLQRLITESENDNEDLWNEIFGKVLSYSSDTKKYDPSKIQHVEKRNGRRLKKKMKKILKKKENLTQVKSGVTIVMNLDISKTSVQKKMLTVRKTRKKMLKRNHKVGCVVHLQML